MNKEMRELCEVIGDAIINDELSEQAAELWYDMLELIQIRTDISIN